MRKIAILLVFVVLIWLFFWGGAYSSPKEGQGLTIKKAIELTLRTNPEFSTVAKQKLISEQRLKQSKSSFFPTLDLNAESGFEFTDTPVINDEELLRRKVTLTMTQLLFDGATTINNIKRDKILSKAADYKLFEAGEFTALSVTNSYLNVLRRRELLNIAKQNIKAHTDMLARIKDGVRGGKFNKGDLAQAISRVARARANFESVKQSLADAEANYKNTVGIAPPTNMYIPHSLEDYIPEKLSKLIEQAKEKNPTISSLSNNIEAAEADYKSSHGINFPTVELQVSGTKGEDISGIEGGQDLGSALMVMRWNLFRGGRDKARIKESFYQKDIAQNNKAAAIRSLERDIRSTWAARKSAIKQLAEFKEQVKANKKVVEVYYDQFKLNRRTLLDLLNTQNELFISKSNLTNVFYSKLFADYRLIALRGDLLKILKIKIPSLQEIIVEKPPQKAPIFTEIKLIPAKAPKKAELSLPKSEDYIKVVDKKTATKVIDLSSSPKNYFIQLGAYKDSLEAEEKLSIINKRYSNLLKNLTKRIQKANLKKKGTYFRVQAGPVSKGDALNICKEITALKWEGCFIVKQ